MAHSKEVIVANEALTRIEFVRNSVNCRVINYFLNHGIPSIKLRLTLSINKDCTDFEVHKTRTIIAGAVTEIKLVHACKECHAIKQIRFSVIDHNNNNIFQLHMTGKILFVREEYLGLGIFIFGIDPRTIYTLSRADGIIKICMGCTKSKCGKYMYEVQTLICLFRLFIDRAKVAEILAELPPTSLPDFTLFDAHQPHELIPLETLIVVCRVPQTAIFGADPESEIRIPLFLQQALRMLNEQEIRFALVSFGPKSTREYSEIRMAACAKNLLWEIAENSIYAYDLETTIFMFNIDRATLTILPDIQINAVKICMLQTKTTEGILLIDNNMEVLRLFNPQRESVFRLAFPGYFH
jgi:hypothetical protein